MPSAGFFSARRSSTFDIARASGCLIGVGVSLALAVAVAGCASSPVQRSDEPLINDPLPASEAAPPLAPTTQPAVAPPAARPCPPLVTGPSGTILRRDLDRMLAGSPGSFLAHVDVIPVKQGAHFVGWRIRSLFPGEPRFALVPLCTGDVVTRINDLSVERPEQFMDVWQALATAPSLRVALLRDGKPALLTFPIEASTQAPHP